MSRVPEKPSAAGPFRPDPIHTDSEGLTCRDVRIETSAGALPAYAAAPSSAKSPPVVLVIQEIFGVHEHIRDVVRRFAKLGYSAIAPELFFRQGDPSEYADIGELRARLVSKVPDSQVLMDLDRALAWAVESGGDAARIAVTGFCWGGRVTWLYAAHQSRVRAAVAWYGKLEGAPSPLQPAAPIDVVESLKAPVLGLYGGEDQGISLDSVERMRERLRAHDVPSEIRVYPDAPHAFFADYRASFRPDAARDGWARLLTWFRTHGV